MLYLAYSSYFLVDTTGDIGFIAVSDWLLNKAEANKSRINNNKFKLGKNKIKNKGKKTEKGKRLQLKKDNRLLALIRLRFTFFQTSSF